MWASRFCVQLTRVHTSVQLIHGFNAHVQESSSYACVCCLFMRVHPSRYVYTHIYSEYVRACVYMSSDFLLTYRYKYRIYIYAYTRYDESCCHASDSFFVCPST